MLGNGSKGEESKKGSDGPPTPKRASIDEDGLIAEAVFAYAVSLNEETDLPTTYAQAMASDDVSKWREAINAKLRTRKTRHGHYNHGV